MKMETTASGNRFSFLLSFFFDFFLLLIRLYNNKSALVTDIVYFCVFFSFGSFLLVDACVSNNICACSVRMCGGGGRGIGRRKHGLFLRLTAVGFLLI